MRTRRSGYRLSHWHEAGRTEVESITDICPECEAKRSRFGIDVGTMHDGCEVIRQATHP